MAITMMLQKVIFIPNTRWDAFISSFKKEVACRYLPIRKKKPHMKTIILGMWFISKQANKIKPIGRNSLKLPWARIACSRSLCFLDEPKEILYLENDANDNGHNIKDRH